MRPLLFASLLVAVAGYAAQPALLSASRRAASRTLQGSGRIATDSVIGGYARRNRTGRHGERPMAAVGSVPRRIAQGRTKPRSETEH